jgi:Arc/MetJ-type ribon-helix-helix transcriptional regulator
MSEYTTISLRKEFVADVEAYIEDEPFGSAKEFVKHVVVREMESDDEIGEAEARQIGQKLRDLGYVE